MFVDNEALLEDSEVIGKNIPLSSIYMENTKVDPAFLSPFTISLMSHCALPRSEVSEHASIGLVHYIRKRRRHFGSVESIGMIVFIWVVMMYDVSFVTVAALHMRDVTY